MYRSRNLLFSIFLCINSIYIFSQGQDIGNRIRISEKLNWTEIEVTIEEISYEKELIAKSETGQELSINIEYLKDFFLNKAVEVSGMEINYSYLYENVAIFGQINTHNCIYRYSYNLAGFGSIWIQGTENYIHIADPSMEVPL